jgi:formiminoglutamase
VARNHGRPGAAGGPRELRRALSNFAWHGSAQAALLDAGDVTCEGDALEAAQLEYATHLANLLRDGHLGLGLGGGHEIAWAAYQGLAQAYAGSPRLERLGIVNFDAHLDLRMPEVAGQGTSGTPFLQIAEARAAAGLPFRYLCIGASETSNTPALLRRAASLGADVVYDTEAVGRDADGQVRRFVEESSAIYLTFCLDVLPPAAAPGVSAPSTLGLPPHRAVELLRSVLAACGHGPRGKLAIADVAELNPRHDQGGRTARVAARILYEIASPWLGS